MRHVTRGHGLLEGFLAERRAGMADRLVPEPCRAGRILDIGCGPYPLFLSQTAFHQKYALDKALEDTDPLLEPGITVLHHDIGRQEPLPFEDRYFDVVTMLALLEHVEPARVPALLQEVHRVLRPGGVYILTTPASWTRGLLKWFARLRLVSPEEIADHKAGYTHARIAPLLTEAGFPAEHLSLGYFECFTNIWAKAQRSPDG